jgi:hypothetical protein
MSTTKTSPVDRVREALDGIRGRQQDADARRLEIQQAQRDAENMQAAEAAQARKELEERERVAGEARVVVAEAGQRVKFAAQAARAQLAAFTSGNARCRDVALARLDVAFGRIDEARLASERAEAAGLVVDRLLGPSETVSAEILARLVGLDALEPGAEGRERARELVAAGDFSELTSDQVEARLLAARPHRKAAEAAVGEVREISGRLAGALDPTALAAEALDVADRADMAVLMQQAELSGGAPVTETEATS